MGLFLLRVLGYTIVMWDEFDRDRYVQAREEVGDLPEGRRLLLDGLPPLVGEADKPPRLQRRKRKLKAKANFGVPSSELPAVGIADVSDLVAPSIALGDPDLARLWRFFSVFVQTWSTELALRAAGVQAGNAKVLGATWLKHDIIRMWLKQFFEAGTANPDEIRWRLTSQARAEYAAYILPNGNVDLDGLIAAGLGHLVKSVTRNFKTGDITVEFYNAQTALDMLAKMQDMYPRQRSLGVSVSTGREGDNPTTTVVVYIPENGRDVNGPPNTARVPETIDGEATAH